MICAYCGKEIKPSESHELFGVDGDFIHKKCRAGINKEMDDLANMSDSEFYGWMGTSDIMKED